MVDSCSSTFTSGIVFLQTKTRQTWLKLQLEAFYVSGTSLLYTYTQFLNIPRSRTISDCNIMPWFNAHSGRWIWTTLLASLLTFWYIADLLSLGPSLELTTRFGYSSNFLNSRYRILAMFRIISCNCFRCNEFTRPDIGRVRKLTLMKIKPSKTTPLLL